MDDLGVSSIVGGTFSETDLCDKEAVSALEPLSLASCDVDVPEPVVCDADGPVSPVSSNLLNASTSSACF